MSNENSNDTIGNRNRDLLACSAVPHTTAPPRASQRPPKLTLNYNKDHSWNLISQTGIKYQRIKASRRVYYCSCLTTLSIFSATRVNWQYDQRITKCKDAEAVVARSIIAASAWWWGDWGRHCDVLHRLLIQEIIRSNTTILSKNSIFFFAKLLHVSTWRWPDRVETCSTCMKDPLYV